MILAHRISAYKSEESALVRCRPKYSIRHQTEIFSFEFLAPFGLAGGRFGAFLPGELDAADDGSSPTWAGDFCAAAAVFAGDFAAVALASVPAASARGGVEVAANASAAALVAFGEALKPSGDAPALVPLGDAPALVPLGDVPALRPLGDAPAL